jgi:hypothetical protein
MNRTICAASPTGRCAAPSRQARRHGLATEHAPGVWELSDRLEPTLREMGERGDIIRTMQKALRAEGAERDPMSFQIHDAAPSAPIVGRVIDKHLSDELGENLTLVVDGIDGRTHHVSGIDPARVEDARIGSVIEIGPPDSAGRPSDRTIAGMAEDGIYRPSRHLEQARFDGRVPNGDYEGFVDAHVRAGGVAPRRIAERIDADQWRIPEDFEARAAAHDAGRTGRANIRVLSTFGLERQIGSDGATWLDRRLVRADTSDLSSAGFGEQVREAMDRRREHHIDRGDAARQPDGRIARRNLIATLREREVARRRRAGGKEVAAVPHGRQRRDRHRRLHRNRAAIERQVRHRREVPRVHPRPVAAGHRPPARPRSHGRRAERIGVVAVGPAKRAGNLTQALRTEWA